MYLPQEFIMQQSQYSDILVADALTLLSESLSPRMVKLAEQIALDPEAWGLNEYEITSAQDLCSIIIGCMTSYIYDAGDENNRLGEEKQILCGFFYALADEWMAAALKKSKAQ